MTWLLFLFLVFHFPSFLVFVDDVCSLHILSCEWGLGEGDCKGPETRMEKKQELQHSLRDAKLPHSPSRHGAKWTLFHLLHFQGKHCSSFANFVFSRIQLSTVGSGMIMMPAVVECLLRPNAESHRVFC
ncbi:hypothetical protein F5Y03DRAFT_326010 [Xylaria venustula]|nr:hypothetical protein F5Y03DRAFT_326010 [Xylaria venustula]